MYLRGRQLALGAAGAIIAGIVVTSTPLATRAATAPGSMASVIASVPLRPATCTATQLANVDIDRCALYANGNPDDHGFPTPPFPTADIVTTPITAEQWVPLTIGSTGSIVVLTQRALRATTPNLADDGNFGSVTAAAVSTAQTALGHEATGIVDALLAEQLGVLVTATLTFPGPGWEYNGNTYSGSPILADWEARLVQGIVRADPDVAAVFEGFLAQINRGTLRVDEKSAYGFRCVATSTRNCSGMTPDQLSYHAWGAAIDVNWTQNPLQTVSHSSDACSAPMQAAAPEWVIKAAQHWGLFWGGWYSCPRSGARSVTKDPHHFEFRGTPEMARRIVAKNTSAGAASTATPAIGDLLLNCGDRGEAVAELRGLLLAGDRPSESASLAETFTSTLANAIAGLQARNGLPTTGALDTATAALLGVTVRHSEVFPVLRMNSCGDAVRALQTAIGASVTGTFTSTTMTQLRTWQKARGLPPTGITDTATAAALGLKLTTNGSGGGSTTTSSSTSSSTSSTTSSTTTSTITTTGPPTTTDPSTPQVIIPLKPGNRSASVSVLQQALVDAGYATPVSGSFGTTTSRHLRAFKKANGLPVTSTLTIAAARLLGLAPVPKVPTRYGERGEHVLLLQQALQAEGHAIAADARFGAGTRAALKAHQLAAGLTASGRLDGTTAKTFGW